MCGVVVLDQHFISIAQNTTHLACTNLFIVVSPLLDLGQDTIYQNVVTNHGNIVTTFSAIQQLKVLLGEISEGLAADREEEEEEATRRLQTDCESTKDGNLNIFTFNCTKRSCEDPSRVCDGTYYYPYVAALKGAGCDDLDSDGDGLFDVCEDRYPPGE